MSILHKKVYCIEDSEEFQGDKWGLNKYTPADHPGIDTEPTFQSAVTGQAAAWRQWELQGLSHCLFQAQDSGELMRAEDGQARTPHPDPSAGAPQEGREACRRMARYAFHMGKPGGHSPLQYLKC